MVQNNKKILISTMGQVLAHVGRTLLIGRELRERGHHVVFSGQGRYLNLIEQDGFDVISIDGLDGKRLLRKSRKTMPGVNIFTAETFESLIHTDLMLIEETQPDVVIFDLQPSMGVAAPHFGVPSVSVANAYMTNYAIPPIRDLLFPPLVRWFMEPIRRWIAGKPYRELASKYPIPRNAIFRDLLMMADLVLFPDIPEFSPTRNLPERFKYCGPLIWEPTNGSIKVLESLDPERPTIYFTLGSTGLPGLFKKVIKDLRDTDYQVILTTGDQVKPEELNPLPRNFYMDSYIPGSAIMKRSQVVICHGGNGTIYQAMGAGLPVLALPTHVDQKANAYLLAKQGAGLMIEARDLEQVMPSLKHLYEDASYRENAVRIKAIMDMQDGPKTAANLIEGLL